jgi:hypothetical protein
MSPIVVAPEKEICAVRFAGSRIEIPKSHFPIAILEPPTSRPG